MHALLFCGMVRSECAALREFKRKKIQSSNEKQKRRKRAIKKRSERKDVEQKESLGEDGVWQSSDMKVRWWLGNH